MTARTTRLGTLPGNYTLWRDSVTGLAWAEDPAAPIKVTCHPAVSEGPDQEERVRSSWSEGERLVRAAGLVVNVETYDALTTIEREVGSVCQCVGCAYRRDHAARRVTVRRMLQTFAALHRKDLAGRHGGRLRASGWAPGSCDTCKVADAAARRHDLKLPSHEESTLDTEMEEA